MFDSAHRLSSLVTSAVFIVCKSFDVVWLYIYIQCGQLCSRFVLDWISFFITTLTVVVVVDACNQCYLLLFSELLQRQIQRPGLSCSWTHISPPCDSLFRNAPAHLAPLAAPVKSWFAHRHGQRHINSMPCWLAQAERQCTQTNQTQHWYERKQEQKRESLETDGIRFVSSSKWIALCPKRKRWKWEIEEKDSKKARGWEVIVRRKQRKRTMKREYVVKSYLESERAPWLPFLPLTEWLSVTWMATEY